MKVIDVFGGTEIDIKDMHSDQMDGMYLYPKMIPSYIRQKILTECQRTNKSELQVIVNTLIINFER